MPDVTARHYQGQPGTAVAVLATVPAATQFNVQQIHVANATAAVAVFTLHTVASAGTPGVTNIIASSVSVPPNGITQITGLFVLAAGETIQGLQTTAGALTVTITGVTTT